MNDVDLLEDPVLAGLFDELRALGDGPPPPVGDELAALFAGAVPIAKKGRKAAVIALVGVAVLGGTVGTAAANSLPDPAQRFVAGVVRTLTPFDLPTPAGDDNATRPAPAVPTPADQTVPTQAPVPGHPSGHAAQPSPAHQGADEGSGTGDNGSDGSRSTSSNDSDDSHGSTDGGSSTPGTSGSDDGATSGSSDDSGSSDSGQSGTSDGSSSGASSDGASDGSGGSTDSGSGSGSSGGRSDDGSPDSVDD